MRGEYSHELEQPKIGSCPVSTSSPGDTHGRGWNLAAQLCVARCVVHGSEDRNQRFDRRSAGKGILLGLVVNGPCISTLRTRLDRWHDRWHKVSCKQTQSEKKPTVVKGKDHPDKQTRVIAGPIADDPGLRNDQAVLLQPAEFARRNSVRIVR